MSLAIVTAVRSRYPTPLGAQHLAFLNAVGVELGLGLVQKTSGTFIPHPTAGGVSQDVLMSRDGAAFDVLIDAEGAANPAWNSIAPIDPSRYVPALGATLPDPGVPDPPVPQPPPCDLSTVLAKLDTLQQSVDEVNAAQAAFRREFDAVAAVTGQRESEIWLRQGRAYTGRVWGSNVKLTPEAK